MNTVLDISITFNTSGTLLQLPELFASFLIPQGLLPMLNQLAIDSGVSSFFSNYCETVSSSSSSSSSSSTTTSQAGSNTTQHIDLDMKLNILLTFTLLILMLSLIHWLWGGNVLRGCSPCASTNANDRKIGKSSSRGSSFAFGNSALGNSGFVEHSRYGSNGDYFNNGVGGGGGGGGYGATSGYGGLGIYRNNKVPLKKHSGPHRDDVEDHSFVGEDEDADSFPTWTRKFSSCLKDSIDIELSSRRASAYDADALHSFRSNDASRFSACESATVGNSGSSDVHGRKGSRDSPKSSACPSSRKESVDDNLRWDSVSRDSAGSSLGTPPQQQSILKKGVRFSKVSTTGSVLTVLSSSLRDNRPSLSPTRFPNLFNEHAQVELDNNPNYSGGGGAGGGRNRSMSSATDGSYHNDGNIAFFGVCVCVCVCLLNVVLVLL